MSRPELRTYCLSAVLTVLLGAGIGFGWHYLADSSGAGAVASAATPSSQQDAANPASPNPPAQREGPALQPAGSMALDLSDEEKIALVALLTRTIANDRYPSSSRLRTLRDILTKLDAKLPVRPYPALVSAPSGEEAPRMSRRQ